MSCILSEIVEGASPGMSEIVTRLGERLPLLHQLEQTPQDPIWHAEGNVLIHCNMVLEQLYSLLDTQLVGIKKEKRAALVLAAALHDIAKPLATQEREIDGRVRVVSPRHELRGRSYLALQLAGALPFDILESLMAMTGYHNGPKLLVVRNKDRGDYLRLSRYVDMQGVYWLEQADMRGRVCVDQEAQLEHLEMFKIFSQDYECWEEKNMYHWTSYLGVALRGYPGATLDFVTAKAMKDLESGSISTPEEAVAKSYGYRDEYPELVIPVGISGSGKTSWIARHLPEHKIVSLDDIRASLSRREDQENNSKVVRMARELLRVHLRAKERIVWDATSLRTDFRNQIIDLAKDYGALTTIVAFHVSPDELAKRNKTRQHPVSAGIRLTQSTRAQWPELSESHRFINVDSEGRVLSAHGFPSGLPYGLQGENSAEVF